MKQRQTLLHYATRHTNADKKKANGIRKTLTTETTKERKTNDKEV